MDKFNETQLENILKTNNIVPSKEWQAKSRSDLLNFMGHDVTNIESNRKENRFNLFFNFFYMTRKQSMLLGIGAFALLTTFAGVGGFLAYQNKNKTSVQTIALSQEEKNEIYAKVLKANSEGALKPTLNESRTSTNNAFASESLAASDSMISSKMIYIERDPNTYTYTKTTYENGPKAESCKAVSSYIEDGSSTEYYEYFIDTYQSHTKYTNYDKYGDLIDYAIYTNTADKNEAINFRGGKYAVKTINSANNYMLLRDTATMESGIVTDDIVSYPDVDPAMPVEPVSFPEETPVEPEIPVEETPTGPSVEDQIKALFGEDADITKIVKEDDKEYYVISWSYNIDCDAEARILAMSSVDSIGGGSGDTKIVNTTWVDSETFESAKYFSYINEDSDNNLVNGYEIESETKTVDFAEVANIFNFEFNTTIKEVRWDLYTFSADTEIANIISYLDENNMDLLFVEDGKAKLQSIYSTEASNNNLPEGSDYYLDRDFYPSGSKGEKYYQEATSYLNDGSFVEADVYMSLLLDSQTYDSVSMNIYSKDLDRQKIVDANVYGEAEIKDINLNINGQNVAATMYTVNNSGIAASSEGSAASELVDPSSICLENTDCSFETITIYFEYGNSKYILTYYVQDQNFDISNLKFSAYNTNNAADFEIVKSRVTQTLEEQYRPVEAL